MLLPSTLGPFTRTPVVQVEYHGEYEEFTSEEISSIALIKVEETPESYLATTIADATIPAYPKTPNIRRTTTPESPPALTLSTKPISPYGFDKKEFKRKHQNDPSNARAFRRLRKAGKTPLTPLSSAPQPPSKSTQASRVSTSTHPSHALVSRNSTRTSSRSMLEPVERILRDTKVEWSSVCEIVLVGVSTRIPRIANLVLDLFNGKEPNKSINSDVAVAFVAAVQAVIVSGDMPKNAQDSLFLLCGNTRQPPYVSQRRTGLSPARKPAQLAQRRAAQAARQPTKRNRR
ncbi:HSP70-domain-containing protein [Rickenella mellea]|uniref:HSP70-domain-containing protein n=1 Tax=Rickenella mellea TaxID=50990 RepID=A0A4Y7PH86_9AGAM|nr:HSP70-domain-containing protein [Rickenella mellea]